MKMLLATTVAVLALSATAFAGTLETAQWAARRATAAPTVQTYALTGERTAKIAFEPSTESRELQRRLPTGRGSY